MSSSLLVAFMFNLVPHLGLKDTLKFSFSVIIQLCHIFGIYCMSLMCDKVETKSFEGL